MSGYIGKAKAVNFAKVDLPIRDGNTNIIEQDGSYYLKEGASIKDQNGNTIIASDGTIAGVDFTPIETQLDSIEQDITSLDTSIGLLEDSVENITYPAGGEIIIGGNILASHTGVEGAGSLTLGNTVAPASSYMFRNKVINGNFDVWQRDTSFTISNSTNSYSADRWRFVGTNFTGTLTRENFNPGQTDVPYNPDYFAKWTVTTNPAANIVFAQYVENVRTLAGKTATLSLYLKSSSTIAADSLQIRYRQQTTGQAGGTVSNVSTAIGEITTSWQKFTFQLNIPSLTGATLGESNASYLAIEILSPTAHTSAFDLSIAQVQLEEGPVATPFEHRPYGLELNLCRRYFEKGKNSYCSTGYHTSYIRSGQPFLVEKRVNPTVIFIGTKNSAGGAVTISSASSSTHLGWQADGVGTSYGLAFAYEADAEL